MSSRTEPGECPAGTPTLLALPCSIFDALSPEQKLQITAIQLSYASDSAASQSAAYGKILQIVQRPQQGGPSHG